MSVIPLIVEHEPNATIFKLNRPEVHNAINDELMSALEDALNALDAEKNEKPLILTHAGSKTFCAGGDLSYFARLHTAEACERMSLRMQKVLDRLENSSRWVVAALDGQALGGGCEVISACHYRIAATHAKFSFRQAPNGIITGWGGGRRILTLLGRSKALRLFLTGETLSAEQALKFGLVDEICPPGEVLQRARQLCEQVRLNDGAAVKGFLDLAAAYRLAHQTVAEVETDIFVRLWTGETFQKIVERFRIGNKSAT
ncbi:MAG: enoyl-CoA hydratase/isomerase family protein [Calditrichia bacterium]